MNISTETVRLGKSRAGKYRSQHSDLLQDYLVIKQSGVFFCLSLTIFQNLLQMTCSGPPVNEKLKKKDIPVFSSKLKTQLVYNSSCLQCLLQGIIYQERGSDKEVKALILNAFISKYSFQLISTYSPSKVLFRASRRRKQ